MVFNDTLLCVEAHIGLLRKVLAGLAKFFSKKSSCVECAANGVEITVNYSEKIARLEEILQTMERGSVPLEQVIELYREGQAIVGECRDFLTKAEGSIKKLEDDGTLSDFHVEEDV